jgi:leader peptidase (prepilin peptidase)/N-methyltransferase
LKLYLWLYIYIVVFIGGLCAGSYMNVLIYRLPRGINTVKGRSFCPDCGHTLHWYDLFPLFSFIFLGGRCRYCRAPISPRYAAIELLNALLWVAYAHKFMLNPITMAAHFIFGSALICIIFIDAKHMLIFDRFNVAIALAGVMIAADKYIYENLQHHHEPFPQDVTVIDRLIGAVCISGLFYLIALLSRGRYMGGGDIKLTAAAGLVLGWKNMLGVLVIASFAGSVCSLTLMAIDKLRAGRESAGNTPAENPGTSDTESAVLKSDSGQDGGLEADSGQDDGEPDMPAGHVVPFGPYLAGAMILMSFYGNEIIGLYLKLCGF